MAIEHIPGTPMSVEYLISLGMTESEAIGINKTQSHQPPADLDELIEYINQANRYEDAMESINYDFNTGDITDERRVKNAEEAYRLIYGTDTE